MSETKQKRKKKRKEKPLFKKLEEKAKVKLKARTAENRKIVLNPIHRQVKANAGQ